MKRGFLLLEVIVALGLNLDVWESLPRKVQDIMMEVGREYSYAVAKATQAKAEIAVKDMKEKGVKFYTLPQEEKRKWLKLISGLASQKAKEADKFGQPGTRVMKYYVDEMAKAGYEWPIKWVIK